MIGVSLGMALKNKHADKIHIKGYDSDDDAQKHAKKTGAIDQACWKLPDAVRDADIVVIATPAIQAYDILESIAPHLQADAVITDTIAANAGPAEWAKQILPKNADNYISGCPLAGNNLTGFNNARPNLFAGAKWAVSLSPKTSARSTAIVRQMIEDVEASPIFMDAQEHDSFTAAASALPLTISIALLSVLSESPSWPDIFRFVGTHFDAATKPAGSEPASTVGGIAVNADLTAEWIDIFIEKLQTMKEAILDYERSLDPDGKWANACVTAWETRVRLDAGVYPKHGAESDPLPNSAQALGSLFLGETAYKRLTMLNQSGRDSMKYDRSKLR